MSLSQPNPCVARIAELRKAMQQNKIDMYIVPSADPHMSEYLPEHWQGRQWLTGFTGSVATLIVTQDNAWLCADGRYWIQAEQQLTGSGIELYKLISSQNSYTECLLKYIEPNSCVGIDGSVLAIAMHKQLLNLLAPYKANLITNLDLLADIWSDRPGLPEAPIFEYPIQFQSTTVAQKLANLRQEMQAKNSDWHLISSLDDIAWLTNTRGSDISYCPIYVSHFLLSADEAFLFIDANKVPDELKNTLAKDGIKVTPYHAVSETLAQIKPNDGLLLDSQKVAIRSIENVVADVRIIDELNPTTFAKACKDEKEISNLRHAMEEDGIALCEFFAWLEQAIANDEYVSEITVDEKLFEFRSKRENFVGLSFGTIAGFNPNGALPHYSATKEHHSQVKGDGLLLIDSGAQYYDGTTDITRVVPIGKITDQHKRDFTMVLKAHIALATAYFPDGIMTPLLDTITRAPLWAQQMNYNHGTGHGVGSFLNVHEGPQSISYFAPVLPKTKMKSGMLTSNEPGLYRENQWGIRIENLVLTIQVPQPAETQFGDFLCFETVTLCPIDPVCIDTSYLTQTEIDWVNNYHQEVLARLKDKVTGAGLNWLLEKTKPI